MTDKEHKSEHPGIPFEEVWKSLEEKDKTGVYKRAREMADIAVEQLEYAYNSGYETAKAISARPQGEWIENKDKWGLSYICPFCGHEITGIPQDLNYCCKCGADMRKGGTE